MLAEAAAQRRLRNLAERLAQVGTVVLAVPVAQEQHIKQERLEADMGLPAMAALLAQILELAVAQEEVLQAQQVRNSEAELGSPAMAAMAQTDSLSLPISDRAYCYPDL